MRLDQLTLAVYIYFMKSFILTIFILLSSSVYGRDYSCLYYVVDRHNASFIQKISAISSWGINTACALAKKQCENYIETNKSHRQFCYKENESIFVSDLRFNGAKAYYLGELKREFTALCYGTTLSSAEKYCTNQVMDLCENFIFSKTEEDWYCSFY
jgi:hypothetical protein